ncbi:MAG: MFS transporter [Chloroflexota bacterium]
MNSLEKNHPLDIKRRNFRNVQIDAIGVSIANVASPFLPVFLTRLGATNFQVGLLSSMPGITGLILALFVALFVGRFLQSRRNIVPWYSLSRLLVISSYALTGLLTLFISQQHVITSTLVIWALATLPMTALAVAFSVVMNSVAGPEGRYALLSRRWAIFGLTSVIGTFLVTRVIDRITFPSNYALMFLGLSLGGLISFYFSRRITIPDQAPHPFGIGHSPRDGIRDYLALMRSNPAFVSFASKRFVYLSALALGAPILPLFFVREVGASDAQIGTITMVFTLFMLMGYFLWPRVSKKRGGRVVLLATTFGMVLYPALTAATPRVEWILAFAGIAGLFQSGLDLVFFDELMKTVPQEYTASFVALAQSLQYLSAFIAPMVGTALADVIGLGGALLVSAGLRLLGFILFLKPDRRKENRVTEGITP